MASPKITKGLIEQEINLKEVFGIDFAGNRPLKEAIGQAIIDRIVSRTKEGKGMSFSDDGRGREVKLKSPYSSTYAKSDDFKAAGKSRNKVNLTLTGDMLSSIDIKSMAGNSITIGITDNEDKQKAFNHNTGDTVPRRPFFGVNKRELNQIKSEFSSEIKDIMKIRATEGRKAFNDAVLNLIDRIGSDGESES